jgi:hypothetical protein
MLIGVTEVSVAVGDIATIRAAVCPDAEVVRSRFAHEQFGGHPEVGRSQVLPASELLGSAKWVVSVPPATREVAEGRAADAARWLMQRTMHAIHEFNKGRFTAKMTTVLYFLPGLRGWLDDAQDVANAVRSVVGAFPSGDSVEWGRQVLPRG